MIIGIDGNEANVEKKVGVSVYTFELLKHFRKAASRDLRFIIFLRHKPRYDLPQQNQYFTYQVVKGPFLWRNLFLPLALKKRKKIAVFFSPAHYTPRYSKIPIVVTIHDLAYVRYPEEFLKQDLYKLSHWTKHALGQSEKIIAVSQSTKNDLIYYYGINKNKVKVVYNGFSSKEEQSKDKPTILEEYNLKPGKYILFAGTIQPRKNIQTLLHAFRLILESKPDMKLILVGKKGWLYDKIFKISRELELNEHAIFTDYISNADMATLYNNASVFVLPSLYEGFGLPILEAMSHNCPVIASERSSLPEVCDDACLFFSPHNAVQLKDEILKVLNSKTLREKLITKGQIRVKNFSWAKCAHETLNVLKSGAD